MKISEKIKSLRKKYNFTQKELAQKTNVSPQVISNWERGYTSPSAEDITLLAKSFNINTDEILSTKDTNENNTNQSDIYNPLDEINHLLKKYDIDQSGFFDIEKWKAMGPDEIRELESYFDFITSRAKEKNKHQE